MPPRSSKRKAAKPRRKAVKGKGLGGFKVVRRIPAFALTPSQIAAGTIGTTNSTVLKLGAVVPAQSLAVNYYDVPFSLEMHLSDIDTFADITSICDKYRIGAAALNIITNPGSYFGGAALPYLQFVADYDDSTPPTASVLNQKMGLKTRTFNSTGMTKISLKPTPITTVLNATGGNLSAISPRVSPYLNSTAPDIPHYGLKGIIRNVYLPGTSAAVQNIAFDISLSVYARDLQ